MTPKKLVSNCAFISSNERSSNAPKRAYPALLTSTSILPFSKTIFSIASFTEISSVTSAQLISKVGFQHWLSIPDLQIYRYSALKHMCKILFLLTLVKLHILFHLSTRNNGNFLPSPFVSTFIQYHIFSHWILIL